MLSVFGWLWFITYYDMNLVNSFITGVTSYVVWCLVKLWFRVKASQGGTINTSVFVKAENFTRKNLINLFFAGILITQWIYDRDKFFALPASTIYWYIAIAYFGSWLSCIASRYMFGE